MQPPRDINLDKILQSKYKRVGYSGFIPYYMKKIKNDKGYDNRHNVLVGELVLFDGTRISPVKWRGQYVRRMSEAYMEIKQLNYRFDGKYQLQAFSVIKGSIPVEKEKRRKKEYYVIDGYKKDFKYVAKFFTYSKWVKEFIMAMNKPETKVVSLSPESSVYYRRDLVGRVARQIRLYAQYGPFIGGLALITPHGNIIPYGVRNPSNPVFSTFTSPEEILCEENMPVYYTLCF
jgi:hypothetical protein